MASAILTHTQLSSSTIKKPKIGILSRCISSSSNPKNFGLFPQPGLNNLAQWNGLRCLGISVSHYSVKLEKKRKCGGKGVFASLFGVGAPEALVIGVVALLVFGPKGLAEVARNLGKTLREFQPTIRELQDVSREFKSTLEREIGLDDVQNPVQKNYSSSVTNTNSSLIAIEKSEVSEKTTEPNGSISKNKASSAEDYSKNTEEQLQSVATRDEKEKEVLKESQSQPQRPPSEDTVQEAAAVVPPQQNTKNDS